MRSIILALKDLRQIARDRKTILFVLVMPIAFAYFMGMMMGGQASSADERPPVAWVDGDQSDVSQGLADLLRNDGVVRLEVMSQPAAEDAVRAGKVAAAVIVPAGLGEAVQHGTPSQVQVLAAEASESNAQAAISVVQAAATRLTAAAQAGLLSQAQSASWRPFAGEAESQAYVRDGMARAGELWATPALSLVVKAPEARGGGIPSGFAQASPGMLVQFSVFSLMNSAIVLVSERQAGTLRRLLTTPISKAGIVAGKLMSGFALLFLQGLILVVVGHVAFGVRYLASPVATLAVVASFGFCLAALGVLVGSLAKSDDAVVAASLILMFVLSGLGGAWFPLEITGPAFAAIGHLLPSAWAMDAFHSIILRGAGLAGVWAPVGVVLAYGLGFAALAAWRFRFD